MEQSGSVPGMLWSVFVSVSLLCFGRNENISESYAEYQVCFIGMFTNKNDLFGMKIQVNHRYVSKVSVL